MSRQNTVLILLLSFLLLVDFSYSFVQHLNQSLDGDMAWNIVPDEEILPIFENPLGLSAIKKHQTYPNPNRFFCHWLFRYGTVAGTRVLSEVSNPVEAIYLFSALVKTLVQILFILLLATLACGHNRILSKEFLLGAVLISALFQANGFQPFMGIIDKSITYTFFYAMPLLFALVFFRPYLKKWIWRHEQHIGNLKVVIYSFLALLVSLSGPLNTGVVLVVSLLFFGSKLLISKKLTIGRSECLMILISILSLYSLYLGKLNVLTQENAIPILESYRKLPLGLFHILSQKLGFPILIGGIVLNSLIINRFLKSPLYSDYFKILKYILAFSLIYTLLLPLGGYRYYRPLIVRFDTFLPVTVCLIFLFTYSSIIITGALKDRKLIYFSAFLGLFCLFYTMSDKPEFNSEDCERKTLESLHTSLQKTIILNQDCSVLTWNAHPSQEILDDNAKLLLTLGVTEELKELRLEEEN